MCVSLEVYIFVVQRWDRADLTFVFSRVFFFREFFSELAKVLSPLKSSSPKLLIFIIFCD